jgi:hypothetical protein
MDFIEKLPESSAYMAILIVVDQLKKQTIFIPTHNTITSPQLAELFVLHVFSKHRVQSHITSDCGSKFVISSDLSGKPLICDCISHQVIIPKVMDSIMGSWVGSLSHNSHLQLHTTNVYIKGMQE